jgi:hypothetical protein
MALVIFAMISNLQAFLTPGLKNFTDFATRARSQVGHEQSG